MCGKPEPCTAYAVTPLHEHCKSFACPCGRQYIPSRSSVLFTRDVSCQNHSVHGYDSADLVRQAGSRCMPPCRGHLSCRSCDRKCSALEAEAAAISYPCSSSAGADVVPGSRNRLTADVREGGHSAACEPEALLVVVVVAAVAVEGQIWHVYGHSIEPSSLCHNFA